MNTKLFLYLTLCSFVTNSFIDVRLGGITDKTFTMTLQNTELTMNSLKFLDEYSEDHIFPLSLTASPENTFSIDKLVLVLAFKWRTSSTDRSSSLTGIAYFEQDKTVSFTVGLIPDKNTNSRVILRIPAECMISNFKHTNLEKPIVSLTHYLFDVSSASVPSRNEIIKIFQNGEEIKLIRPTETPEAIKINQLYQMLYLKQDEPSISFKLANNLDSLKDFIYLAKTDFKQYPNNKIQFSSCEETSKEIFLVHKNKKFYFRLVNPMFYSCKGLESKLEANKESKVEFIPTKIYNLEDKLFTFSFGIKKEATSAHILLEAQVVIGEERGTTTQRLMLLGITRKGATIEASSYYSLVHEIEADTSDNIAVGISKEFTVASPDNLQISTTETSISTPVISTIEKIFQLEFEAVSLKIIEVSEGAINCKFAEGTTNMDLESVTELLNSQRAIHLYPYNANQKILPLGFKLLDETYFSKTDLFPLENATSMNEINLIEYYEETDKELRIEPSFNLLYSFLTKTTSINQFNFQSQVDVNLTVRNLEQDPNSYLFSTNSYTMRNKFINLKINGKDLVFPVYTKQIKTVEVEPIFTQTMGDVYRLSLSLFYKYKYTCTQEADFKTVKPDSPDIHIIYLIFEDIQTDFTCYVDSNAVQFKIDRKDRKGLALSSPFISPQVCARNRDDVYVEGTYPVENLNLWRKIVKVNAEAKCISTYIGSYSVSTRTYAINILLQTKPNEWIFIPHKKPTNSKIADTQNYLKTIINLKEGSNLIEISEVSYISTCRCFKITAATSTTEGELSFSSPTYLNYLTGIYFDSQTDQSEIIQGKNCENVVQFMQIGQNVFYDVPDEIELSPKVIGKFIMFADYRCLNEGNTNGIFDSKSFSNFQTDPKTGENVYFLEISSPLKTKKIYLRLSKFLPENQSLAISPEDKDDFEVNTVFEDETCVWDFKFSDSMGYRTARSCRTLNKSAISRLIFFFDVIELQVEFNSTEIAKTTVKHASLKPTINFKVVGNKIEAIELDCLFDTMKGTIYYLCGKEQITDKKFRQKLPADRIPRAINNSNHCVFSFICDDNSYYFYREDMRREGYNLFEPEFKVVTHQSSYKITELPSDIPETKKAEIEGKDVKVGVTDIFIDTSVELEEFKQSTDQEKVDKLTEMVEKNEQKGSLNSFIDVIVVSEVTNKLGESLPLAETQRIINSNNKVLKENIKTINSENEEQLLAASQALAVSSQATLKTEADPKVLLEANMNLNKIAEKKVKMSKDSVLKIITGITQTNSNLIKTTINSEEKSKEQTYFEKNIISTVTESTLLLGKLEEEELSITTDKLKISKLPLKNETVKFSSEDGKGFLAIVNYDEYPVKLKGRAKVKAINFFKDQQIQEVKDLKEPIEFVLEKNLIDQNFCVYYDQVTEGWSSEGCTSEMVSPRKIKCSCTHLTDFSLLDYNPYFIARDAVLIFIGANFMTDVDFLFEFTWDSTFILQMYAWICLVHLISLLIACLFDKKDPDLFLVEVNKIYGLCSYEELVDNLAEVRQISQEIVDVKKKEKICEYLKKADRNEIVRKITIIDPDQEAQPEKTVPKLRLLARMKEEIKRQSEENTEAELNLLATAMLNTLRKAKTKKANHLLQQNLSKQELEAIRMRSLYFYRYFALTNFFMKTEYPLVSLFVPSDGNTTKANLVNMFFFQMYSACGVAAIVTPENQKDYSSGNMEDKFNSYDVATTFIVLLMVDIPFMMVEVLLRKNQVIGSWIPELKSFHKQG